MDGRWRIYCPWRDRLNHYRPFPKIVEYRRHNHQCGGPCLYGGSVCAIVQKKCRKNACDPGISVREIRTSVRKFPQLLRARQNMPLCHRLTDRRGVDVTFSRELQGRGCELSDCEIPQGKEWDLWDGYEFMTFFCYKMARWSSLPDFPPLLPLSNPAHAKRFAFFLPETLRRIVAVTGYLRFTKDCKHAGSSRFFYPL